ncbi:MAG: lysine--tRNA ligase [Acidobacteria bacterium]|nr:MAG: lysine--tRNA ligase [Acidobacteriota bacterium]
MSSEEQYLQQRREKLEKLRSLGIDVYPRKFEFSHTIKDIVEDLKNKTAEEIESLHKREQIVGRIVAIRAFGKAGFVVLKQEDAQVQVYMRKDFLGDQFPIYECLDVGDFVGVEGEMFRSKTGELTLKAEKVMFLSKALRPLPEKWHGLQDVELRYRQRYLDLIVNPEVRKIFEIRAKVVAGMRRYFDAHGFIEVETPMMQVLAGGALARPFKTHHNAMDMDLYMRIAPELYLKRLTVGGLDRVYEINRNFRNEGISTMHNPEFTMLEFYIAYYDYRMLMDLTEDLISGLATEVLGKQELHFENKTINLAKPWRRLPMKQALLEIAGIPEAVLDDESKLRTYAQERKIPNSAKLSKAKLWGELFDELVEDQLFDPVFITEYPRELSPLSKSKPDDPDTVERFELYMGGMEIANAYSELNDPAEQRKRFEEQLRQYEAGDQEAHSMDEDYVMALEHGMPPTGGEGIGVDRLTMLFTGVRSIREVILFPLLKPRD